MRTAAAIALVGIVAANPAPAPAPTAAASLNSRTACEVDYDLGRPLQPPPNLKTWLRSAQPPDACTDVMPARLTSAWMAYLGQLSSFVAHAADKTASLTDLCGSATYTVSIEFCATQGKIVVTDEESGDAVTTVANGVRDPGVVVLTSKDGKIGVASAEATATTTSDDGEPVATSIDGSRSNSGVVRTSSKGSASMTTGAATTGAVTTSGDASTTSASASSTGTPKPKENAAGKIGAGAAAAAAGIAVLAL
ncbi:hypothetical protein LMH87_001236 [Akanthomyces muscarius]|uniref:Secreted protein n=1 Tax=Akanthomyces muscarius TaxID=2231603 RepID=A0A9W8UNC2_AKAMU|nr:hypothetical protein LMH87_001236 [Akanthomyces muscarius]KAJ4156022.1 hypothetical protein LMH87_001236 [Akanthomyces muscarius]